MCCFCFCVQIKLFHSHSHIVPNVYANKTEIAIHKFMLTINGSHFISVSRVILVYIRISYKKAFHSFGNITQVIFEHLQSNSVDY